MSDGQDRAAILVIDDEIGPRESMRFLLKDQYDLVCAENVDDGLCRLEGQAFDLIILDIKMPGKSGIEGLKCIRDMGIQIPVVMLTGFGTLETAQQALRLGANDYINKPFDKNEMRETVEHQISMARLERKRKSLLEELKNMNNQLVEELASKDRMAALGETSAEFAHDLRNPLMVITSYVDLLSKQLEDVQEQKDGNDEEIANYLEGIETSVRRCCHLADMWSRGDGAANSTGTERFLVSDLSEALRMSVEPVAFVADVRICVTCDVNGVEMHGNHGQILRALHNVVGNAIDAVSPKTGNVEISVQKISDRGLIEFTVRDNGCGMSQEVMDRMFEPYYTTKSKEKGTGLGTVITRKIVEDHQGFIDVTSTKDEGSCVTIMLPAASPQPDAE